MKIFIYISLLAQLIFAMHLCSNEVSDCVIRFNRLNDSGDDIEEVTISGKAAVELRERLKEIYKTTAVESDEDREEIIKKATHGLGEILDKNGTFRYHIETEMFVTMVFVGDEDRESEEEMVYYYITINCGPKGDYVAMAYVNDDNPHKLSYNDALILKQAGLDLHLDLEHIYELK